MVAIKDFEMPSHCFICPMCNSNNPNRSSVALGTPFTCDITENALLDVHDIRDKDCPLVEAIPKEQYEARLKADMVAMLEEIDEEFDKQYYINRHELHDDFLNRGLEQGQDIIQQKINSIGEINHE